MKPANTRVSVRSDSHTVLDQANFTVDSDINYSENARTTDNVAATNQLNDYTAGNVTYLSRADGFANYAEATAAPAEEAYVMDDATRKEVEANSQHTMTLQHMTMQKIQCRH